ncbi:unnamed protein product [Amaranthus hypochondriacus]
MVGAYSLLSSPVIDSSPTCPCVCLDTMYCSSMNLNSLGDVGLGRKLMGKMQSRSRKIESLKLSSSFVDSGNDLLGIVNKRNLRKQKKVKGLMIVNEIAGQYEDSFEDVKTQLLEYFTIKATRTVLHQLYEMNPPQYTWLYNFLLSNKPGDGKYFIRKLGKEKQDLAERIMVTRLHLYGKWIKKCDHAEIYQYISDENLELMREKLLETIVWPSDDSTEKIG